MQISAISPIKSFGNGEIIDVLPVEPIVTYPVAKSESKPADKFDMDTFDFHAVADAVNKDKPEDKVQSPAKFFLTTGLLALASLAATKKVSNVALKTLEGKLSLDKPLNKLGIRINNAVQQMKARTVGEVTSVKTFFTSNGNKSIKWFGTVFESVGKKGVTPQEVEEFTKMMGKDVPVGALYARNAMRKTAASVLGVGTAGATIAARYKDSDENGIPDKAEKAFGRFTEAKELLSNVASALDLAA